MKHKKLLTGSLWNNLDYSSSLVIYIITTKAIISELGVEGFGFYSFFIALIGLFGMIDMGMGMAVYKYLSESLNNKDFEKTSEIITSSLIFYLILSIPLALVVNSFSGKIIDFLGLEAKYYETGIIVIKLIAFTFVLNLIISLLMNIFMALEEWFISSLYNIAFKIVSAVIIIQILSLKLEDVEKLIWIFKTTLAISVSKIFLAILILKLKSFKFNFRAPSNKLRMKVFRFLKFSSLQYFLSLFAGHFDKFLITKFFGLESVGVYNFCLNAYVYLYGLISNSFKVFFPKLSRLHGEKDWNSLKNILLKLLIFSTTLAIILSISFIVFWKFLISLYINVEFADNSFYLIPFFAILLVLRSPEVIFYYFFNATANPKILVQALLISVIVTVGLYFILIPQYEILGIIISQIIAYTIVIVWHLLMFKLYGSRRYSSQSEHFDSSLQS